MTNAEYMREYRRNNPDYVNKSNIQNKARKRALEQLRRKHYQEFERLYAEELRTLGHEEESNH